MGRKIPGKKHRGVKDPLKQQAQRLKQLTTKINEPPRNKDDQDIPKSLERVIQLKQKVKEGKIVKKKKKKKNQLIVVGAHAPKPTHPNAKPDKVVPIFSQRPTESSRDFLNRVNSETHAFVNETAFETKYGVEVKRNPQTGGIEGLTSKPKDELDEYIKLKQKHENTSKKKKKSKEPAVKLTKAQKKKQKLESKKDKILQDDIDEFRTFKDEVAFGDIVHAPPELTARPKLANSATSGRPGKRNLLLDSLLKPKSQPTNDKVKQTVVNRSGKRKDLPVGERRRLEENQKDAITAYRMLKAQNTQNV